MVNGIQNDVWYVDQQGSFAIRHILTGLVYEGALIFIKHSTHHHLGNSQASCSKSLRATKI